MIDAGTDVHLIQKQNLNAFLLAACNPSLNAEVVTLMAQAGFNISLVTPMKCNAFYLYSVALCKNTNLQ